MAPWFTQFEMMARNVTQSVALVIDFIALFIIAAAALRAIILYVAHSFWRLSAGVVEGIRLDLGRTLVLALEFLIGADILRTAVAPSWSSIGQLGAIVLLRTLLNYFLELEIKGIAGESTAKKRHDSR